MPSTQLNTASAVSPAGTATPVLGVRRHAAGIDYYQLFNMSNTTTVDPSVTLTGNGTPYLLNTWSGGITPVAVGGTRPCGHRGPRRAAFFRGPPRAGGMPCSLAITRTCAGLNGDNSTTSVGGTPARNAVTTTFPDADRSIAKKGAIVPGAAARSFGPHSAKLLRVARCTGIDARPSRDAGSYLCNYLSWRAIEAVNGKDGPRLAQFVHIPLLPRDGTSRRKGAPRITLDELVDAGEAMLMELVRLARQSAHHGT